MEPAAEYDRLLAVQHGVISRGQALHAGLSERSIGLRVKTGRWRTVYPGVYAQVSTPITWHQRLMAVVLRGGATALASHSSAALLWRLDGLEQGAIEVSIQAGRCIKGALVHRRRPTDNPTVAVKDGIPTTGIQRTLLDLCAVVSKRRAAHVMDDALRSGLTTLEKLRELLTTPRAGTRSLRELLDARDDRDVSVESPLETALLGLFRKHGIPLPVPQHCVMEGGDVIARLDFAYPELRLGIEADGFRWHGGVERWRRDLRRENRLKLLGWTVLRFSWWDVHERPEMVASQIRAALGHVSLRSPALR